MSSFLVASNIAAIYAEPDTSAELASQATLGSAVTVREARGDMWRLVETDDRYQGWLRSEHLVPAWDESDHFKTSIATLFAEVYPKPDATTEMLTKLVVGTRVAVAHRPEVEDWVPLRLPDGRTGYVHKMSLNMTHDGTLAGPDLLDQKARRALSLSDLKRKVLQAVGQQATLVGKRLIGTPYLWGGCTPFGLDCSGLTQLTYKLSGLQLLRDAHLQFGDKRFTPVEEGKEFADAEFEAGDLVVFRRTVGRITHVGLALGDGRFLHSSGSAGVRIDPCHDPRYAETYAGAVRLSADADFAIEAA